MKRSFFHFLLIWCLLIALPVQGLAKVGIGACHDGGVEGQAVVQLDDGPDDASIPETAHDADLADAPEPGLHDHAAHDHAAHDDGTTKQHAGHDSHPAKSGHCAPCCIGAALLGHTLTLPATSGNSPVFILPGHIPPSIWLPGPERPPRVSLI
jgi:hypothetical protein